MTEVTRDELHQKFSLLRTDPERYLAMAEELVRVNPDDSNSYWFRHFAFDALGKFELALADLDKVLSVERKWFIYELRGNILRSLGRYRDALEDYNRAEAADPEEWRGGFGRLFRAECHARLGNEEAALADCARLPEDHWTPGLLGAPAGSKAQVIAETKRLAAAARATPNS